MDNPLDILGLKPGDTLEMAHSRRNAIFLRIHPDKDPNHKVLYQKVYDAYELLKSSPHLLDKSNITPVANYDIQEAIKIYLNIDIEDIYYKRNLNTKINSRAFCHKCHGKGYSSKKNSKCLHCEGKGRIDSAILDILSKSPICPICHGTGINPEEVCKECLGNKTFNLVKNIEFSVSVQDYHKKYLVLENCGDQISANHYGPVIILLKFNESPIQIEDNYFVVQDSILPVQRILGDTQELNIFGRTVSYNIERNSKEAYTKDFISEGLTQDIKVKYTDIVPRITKETEKLYREIIRIEKSKKRAY